MESRWTASAPLLRNSAFRWRSNLRQDEGASLSGFAGSLGKEPPQEIEVGAAALARVVIVQLQALEKDEHGQNIAVAGADHAGALRLLLAVFLNTRLYRAAHAGCQRIGRQRLVIDATLERAISADQRIQALAHVKINRTRRGQR